MITKQLTKVELEAAGKHAKAHLERAQNYSDKSEEHYKAAGIYLSNAKATLKHGQWLPWLKRYKIAPRTAQTVMQIAVDPDALGRIRETKKIAEANARSNTPHVGRISKQKEVSKKDEEDDDDYEEMSISERWVNSVTSIASESASYLAYLDKEFGKDWRKYEAPTSVVTLVKEAVESWTAIAKQLGIKL
jgi:hypothetical protein